MPAGSTMLPLQSTYCFSPTFFSNTCCQSHVKKDFFLLLSKVWTPKNYTHKNVVPIHTQTFTWMFGTRALSVEICHGNHVDGFWFGIGIGGGRKGGWERGVWMNEFQLEHIVFKTMIERVHMRNAQETVGNMYLKIKTESRLREKYLRVKVFYELVHAFFPFASFLQLIFDNVEQLVIPWICHISSRYYLEYHPYFLPPP